MNRLAILAFAAAIVPVARISSAAVQYAQEDVSDFGDYSQNATDPEGNFLVTPTSGVPGAQKAPVACAPTAAVNSFQFLQNEYGITGLVGGSPYDTINELASSDYMNTGDTYLNPDPPPMYVGDANTATTPTNFIAGKEKYLSENFKPQNGYTAIQTVGQSIYQSQASNGTTQGGITMTTPTSTFIQQQLADGEDVEMFFLWTDSSGNPTGGGHVVTLTGIDYNSGTNTGDLSFIDPYGGSGQNSGVDITSDSLYFLSPTGYLVFGYSGGGAGGDNDPDNPDSAAYGKVVAVFAESPVPEPATLGLLCGAAVLGLRRRRRV
jgi:hypothetical protein